MNYFLLIFITLLLVANSTPSQSKTDFGHQTFQIFPRDSECRQNFHRAASFSPQRFGELPAKRRLFRPESLDLSTTNKGADACAFRRIKANFRSGRKTPVQQHEF